MSDKLLKLFILFGETDNKQKCRNKRVTNLLQLMFVTINTNLF